jgi:hypothetical protein
VSKTGEQNIHTLNAVCLMGCQPPELHPEASYVPKALSVPTTSMPIITCTAMHMTTRHEMLLVVVVVVLRIGHVIARVV